LREAFESKKKDRNISVWIIPSKSSIDTARALLKSQGSRYDGHDLTTIMVPIFTVTNDRDLLQIQQKKEGSMVTTIPFFFEPNDLQKLIDIIN